MTTMLDISEPITPVPEHLKGEDVRRLYRSMRRIRLTEERIVERYGEGEMRCPVHLSIGQEAASVGVCDVLQRSDLVVGTHRSHAQYLAKGGDLTRMISEIYGKSTGCVGGRGGSMHLMDQAEGMVCSIPIVASGIPLATGMALAQQRQGTGQVVVCYMGDAAVEEGAFHESVNFAVLRGLPIVYVCENNDYSVYVSLKERQPPRTQAAQAVGYGLPAHVGDGNNVFEVRSLSKSAIDRARSGDGPTFLQLNTYRWHAHCGPEIDDHLGYRSEDDVALWRSRCPLVRLRSAMQENELWDETEDKADEDELRAEIDIAFDAASKAPLPSPADAARHTYSEE
jgi:TPP-dependent pyruvate/acetoin dehydrogenase alpha subunit